MLEKPKRLYMYRWCLYFTYRIQYRKWIHGIFKTPYHGYDEYGVGIGIDPDLKLFNRESIWYDGHTYDSITIFFIIFVKSYTFSMEANDE